MAEKLTQEIVDTAYEDIRNGKVWHWNGRTASNSSDVEFILGVEGFKPGKAKPEADKDAKKADSKDSATEDPKKAQAEADAKKAKEEADQAVKEATAALAKAKTDDEKTAAQKVLDEATEARKALGV